MSENPDLNTLKVEILSILNSSSSSLNVRQFLREYKDLNGKIFPYAKLGFKSPEELLRAIPDAITLRPSEMGDVLVPNQNNSVHISKMVNEQKKNPKKGRPRPIQLPRDSQKMNVSTLQRIEAPNPVAFRGWERNALPFQPVMHFNPLPQFSFASANYAQLSHNLWNYDQQIHQPMAAVNTFSSMQTEFTATKLPLIPRKEPLTAMKHPNNLSVTNGYCDNSDPNSSCSISVKSDDHKLKIEEIPHYDDNMPENQLKLEDDHNPKVESPDLSSSSISNEFGEDTNPISDKMKENFRKILSKHKNGLQVSKLASSYFKMFNVTLNCQDYGFPSIKELVMTCDDVFKIQHKKYDKDWLLFDVNRDSDTSKWIPAQVLENMEELSLDYPNGISSDDILKLYKATFKVELDIGKLGFDSLTSFLVNCQSIECIFDEDKLVVFPMKWGKKDNDVQEESTTDPFLSIDTSSIFCKKAFEDNVCSFQFKYETCPIPRDSKFNKVIVADCISPDCLWLQTLDAATSLNDLMFELNTFYDEEEENHIMAEEFVHPGLACCAKFNNEQWHRAIIEEVMKESGTVKVTFVDYGTICDLAIKDLRTLHKKFSKAPIFSFKSKLSNVKPVNNMYWSEECRDFLFDLILNQVFVVEIVQIKNEIASVILIDTKNSEDVLVNHLLIENGFALPIARESPDPSGSQQSENLSPPVCDDEGIRPPPQKHKNYPNYFMKVLPYWLQYGQRSWDDIFQIFEEACQESYSEHNNDNLSVFHDIANSDLCTEDKILELFIKMPNIICNAWNTAFNSIIDMLEKRFLERIEIELYNNCKEPVNEPKCREQRVYESDESSNTKELYNRPKKTSPDYNNGPMSTSSIERRGCNNQRQNADQCETPCRKSNKHRNDQYSNDDSDISPRDDIMDTKVPKVIPANVVNCEMHLIRYRSEIYVLMDDLLSNFAKGLPSMLIEHRLNQRKLNYAPFIVNRQNKLVYNELNRFINLKKESVSLVPLSMAGEIVLAVEPRNKRVSEVLKDLSMDCYSSDEFWSI